VSTDGGSRYNWPVPEAEETVTLGGVDPGGGTLPTVLSRPQPVTSAPATGSDPGSGTWSEQVERALHGEEVARARGWSVTVILLTVCGLTGVPLLPGTPLGKLGFSLTLLAMAVTAAWVWLRCRDEANYTPAVFRTFGYLAATASFELEYFLGVFSPTPLVVTLGITFFGMGTDRKHALAIPLYAISGYFVLMALVTAGVLPDVGIVDATNSTVLGKAYFAALAPLVLLVTLWMARVSRRSMADALQQAADATRLAAQREALLFEAQQDLEQLLRAGAGVSGRFTGTDAGRWRLEELIGRGAMGEVYAARDRETDEPAAIKLLRPEALTKERMVERFLREGQAAGSLDAPNVVKVLGVGHVDLGFPYIAMELLHGQDLAALLRRRRRLDHDEVAALIADAARGLEAAHGSGIVHRDLKPQNLFHHRDEGRSRGVWKILDFGVSKLAGSHGTLTQRAVVGTPGYMAPEQAQGNDVDHRCDVFSLGAVAYRATTGRPPFGGADLPQTLFSIVYQQPPKPSSLADLPKDVDRVLAIALAKPATARFESATALSDALSLAFSSRLSPELRARADRLVTAYPWGQPVNKGG
jgi:serine/threonine-protein kinase